MNTIIAFTLKDLLLSGVYLILILVLFYLLKILITTQRSIKDINNLVKENRTQIDAVLKEAPDIAKMPTPFQKKWPMTFQGLEQLLITLPTQAKKLQVLLKTISLLFLD